MVFVTFDRHGFGFYGLNLPYSVWIGGITGGLVAVTALTEIEKRTPYRGQLENGLTGSAIIIGALVNYALWNAVEEVR
mgnify:CR=1 FL=1